MFDRAQHIHSGAVVRLLLVGVLAVGKCGLMAASAFATGGHGHDHLASGASAAVVSTPHADAHLHAGEPAATLPRLLSALQPDAHPDACCVDTPALVAKGVSLAKPALDTTAGDVIAAPVAPPSHRVLPPRAPPPRLHSAHPHVLLQVFRI